MSNSNIIFKDINPSVCINARIRRLHKTVEGIYQAVLGPFNLKGSMLSILFITGKKEGINHKEISESLVLDPSTVSRDLKKLINQKYIHTKKGKDPRVRELYLSKEGLELVNDISPLWYSTHQKVEKLLGEKNLNKLDEMLIIMKSSNLNSTKK